MLLSTGCPQVLRDEDGVGFMIYVSTEPGRTLKQAAEEVKGAGNALQSTQRRKSIEPLVADHYLRQNRNARSVVSMYYVLLHSRPSRHSP